MAETDLIVRLRSAKMARAGAGRLGNEAAAEIDRLRAKVKSLDEPGSRTGGHLMPIAQPPGRRVVQIAASADADGHVL